MKKRFWIFLTFLFLIFTIIHYPSKSSPVFYGEAGEIEEFSNDEQCLNAVRRLSSAFPELNSAAVLSREDNILCGITTDDNIQISEDLVCAVIYDIFPDAENIRLEINSVRAEDIMELSYADIYGIKEKYISLRFDFLISED